MKNIRGEGRDNSMYWATLGVMVLVGFFVGFLVRDLTRAPWSSVPASCVYNGTTYQPGAAMPSEDNCNRCSCQNGQRSCTAMACGDTPMPPNQ